MKELADGEVKRLGGGEVGDSGQSGGMVQLLYGGEVKGLVESGGECCESKASSFT